MAVQSQSPSNFLILNRSDKEKKEMETSPQAPIGFLGKPAVLGANGANGNPRKRGRRDYGGVPIVAAAAAAAQQQSLPVKFISMQQQACSPAIVSLPHRQMQSPTVVSTGLALTYDDKQFGRRREESNLVVASVHSHSLFSGELEAHIKHQMNEIEQFLIVQGEQLCQALADRRQSHRALLIASEESAARRLREKEEEVERASQRLAGLEECLARLRNESVAWRAKATADQSTIAALHAQLQLAAAAITPSRTEGGARCDTPPAEDAGSACVDPGRAEREREQERACRACRRRRASAVVLPCRHLCLCDACDEAAGSCPICHCVSTGTVRVFFS